VAVAELGFSYHSSKRVLKEKVLLAQIGLKRAFKQPKRGWLDGQG
jgi:hypothetical protein